jgi:hypothetical protein
MATVNHAKDNFLFFPSLEKRDSTNSGTEPKFTAAQKYKGIFKRKQINTYSVRDTLLPLELFLFPDVSSAFLAQVAQVATLTANNRCS